MGVSPEFQNPFRYDSNVELNGAEHQSSWPCMRCVVVMARASLTGLELQDIFSEFHPDFVAGPQSAASMESPAGSGLGGDSPLPGAGGREATSIAGAASADSAAPVAADGAAADAGYVDDDDDEEGMIIHAGFGAAQKPVAASAVGGPVFLGLEDEEEAGDAEEPADASAQPPQPAES